MTHQIIRDEVEAAELSEDLTALSNTNRIQLLEILTEPSYRGEVADALGMSRQSATKHIEKLQERGFLRELQGWRDSGPVTEYQVVPQRLFALGMRIADLGKLEPEGGPDNEADEQTMVLEDEGDARPAWGPSPVPRSAHLLIVTGPEAGERFPLEGDGPRWTIGRDVGRDLALDHDPFISNRHAEIQVDPEGHAVVDVFSSNGTKVNFARLPEGGRTVLEPGDVVGIGRTCLVYQARDR